MSNKLTGQLRLDLSSPVTADDLGELLAEIDERASRSEVEITLQPQVGHLGFRGHFGDAPELKVDLVATWTV